MAVYNDIYSLARDTLIALVKDEFKDEYNQAAKAREVYESIIECPANTAGLENNLGRLAKILLLCEEQEIKANNKKEPLKAAKAILKNSEKCFNQDFAGFAVWHKGKYVLTDGYRIIALNEAIPTLPVFPEGASFDVTLALEKTEAECQCEVDSLAFDTAILRNYIKKKRLTQPEIYKGKDAKRVCVNIGYGVVDAQFLLECLEVLGDNVKVFWKAEQEKRSVYPLFFSSDKGKGCLAVVRPKNKDEEYIRKTFGEPFDITVVTHES